MTSWLTPPSFPRLGNDEVHVWRIELDRPVASVLSPDEKERADRFHFERDRRRFTAARTSLRVLIGRYLGTAREAIEFRYGAHGKPAVVSGSGLEFNVAHSEELALIAFALHRPVGIDVEFLNSGPFENGVAERFFSQREVADLVSLPEAERRTAFYRCWTRKEAFLKANGKGLGYGLDQFTVSLLPDEPAALLDTAVEPDEAARWQLISLDPGPGYAAALAAPVGVTAVRCWRLLVP